MSTHPPPPDSTDRSDHQLMQGFANTGDEAAFREIVNRYAGLVRAVARRTTGEDGLAEETAQTVFALLARKATAAARAGHLGGWLHRTTVFHALRRLRTETRHRRKIAAFATAMPDTPQDHSQAWSDALPLLDASLQRLRESERRVLILRYFEDHSFPAIAVATGKSEDAVKKQTARALDRLRGLMQARSVALTTTALATAMAAQTSAHASVPASALASSALKAASALTWPTLTLHSLHLMNISKPAAAAVILLCTTPLAWQEHAIASARRDVAALEKIHTLPPAAVTRLPAAIPSAGQPAEVVVMDIEQLLKDFHSAYGSRLFTPAAVAVAATKRLDALDGPALDQLLKDIRTHSRDLAQLDYDELRLFQMLEKRAPLLALRAAPALLQRNDDMHQQYQSVVSSCLVALAKEDPDTASKEYRSLCDSGVLEGKGVDSLSYVLHGKFTAALLGTRFEEGKALFATLSEGGKSNALSTAALSTSAETRAFVLGEAADLKPNQRSRIMTGILCGETAQNGLEGATALFKQLPIDPGQSVLIAADFMRKLHSMEKMPVDEGLDWLRAQLPPVQFAEAGGLLLGKVRGFPSNQLQEARNNAFRATDWGPHRDEALAAFFSPESLPDDAGEALSLVVEIRDPALRMDTLRHITSRFKGQPREWEKAVESATTLTAEEKRRIFQP